MGETKDAQFAQTKRGRSLTRDPSGRDPSRAPSKKMRLEKVATRARSRSKSRAPRGESGEMDPERREKLKLEFRKLIKKKQIKGSKNESDRHVYDLMPKHLNTGKRGLGSNQRR